MSWEVEFAKEFKRRDNKPPLGPQIGEVISAFPLRVTMMMDKAIIERQHIYLCSRLSEGQVALKIGDLVACIPTGNKFIVIDKVV